MVGWVDVRGGARHAAPRRDSRCYYRCICAFCGGAMLVGGVDVIGRLIKMLKRWFGLSAVCQRRVLVVWFDERSGWR